MHVMRNVSAGTWSNCTMYVLVLRGRLAALLWCRQCLI